MTDARYAIATAGDANVGDFIAGHWAPSAKACCDLHDVDLVVIDYGFPEGTARRLDSMGVLRVPREKDGHPANIRFRDLAGILESKNYENVMMTDGGDLIFQADVTALLREPMPNIRGCREPSPSAAVKQWAAGWGVDPQMRQLKDRFLSEPMINVGVLAGPASGFRRLWAELSEPMLQYRHAFGTEQLLISAYLLDQGFTPLSCRYNFMPLLFPHQVTRSRGRIYDAQGLVPVVHNCGGGMSIARPLARFGFGRWHNFKRPVLFLLAKRYHNRHASK